MTIIDTTVAPPAAPAPLIAPDLSNVTVAPAVQAVAAKVDAIISLPEVQAVDTALAPKIPAKVRATIYEIAKWVGLVGAGATATAALLHGDSALYVGTAGFVLVSLTNLLAKAHVSVA